MPPLDGNEPIGDEEFLYRRIPVSMGWCNPTGASPISPLAFQPRDDEDTGISLVRGGQYCTVEQAGQGMAKKGYYVAVLPVKRLREHGIEVATRPTPEIPGHVELPGLNARNRDSDEAKSLSVLLATELCIRIEGPFLPPPATK